MVGPYQIGAFCVFILLERPNSKRTRSTPSELPPCYAYRSSSLSPTSETLDVACDNLMKDRYREETPHRRVVPVTNPLDLICCEERNPDGDDAPNMSVDRTDTIRVDGR